MTLVRIATFEHIDDPSPGGTPVSSPYAILNWQNTGAYVASEGDSDNGYGKGVVSGVAVGYNIEDGVAVTFTTAETPFAFHSGYFAAAWNNNLHVVVTAYRDGHNVGHQNFVIDQDSTFVKFNHIFRHIDTVTIRTHGGTDADAGDGGSGTFIAFDNFHVNFDAPTHPAHHPAIDHALMHAPVHEAAWDHWMLA